jgi:hypothetical protein
MKGSLTYRVELHYRGDVLRRRRRWSAFQLHAAPTRDVPDRKLSDQLRLVEAVPLARAREVGQPVQRQTGFRALASLPLDCLNNAPSGCLSGGHARRGQRSHVTFRP